MGTKEVTMPRFEPTEKQKIFLECYRVKVSLSREGTASLIQYIEGGKDQVEKDQRADSIRETQKEWIDALVTHRMENVLGVQPRERVLDIIVRSGGEMESAQRTAQAFKSRGSVAFSPSRFKAVLNRKRYPAIGIERLKIVSEAARASQIDSATELL